MNLLLIQGKKKLTSRRQDVEVQPQVLLHMVLSSNTCLAVGAVLSLS